MVIIILAQTKSTKGSGMEVQVWCPWESNDPSKVVSGNQPQFSFLAQQREEWSSCDEGQRDKLSFVHESEPQMKTSVETRLLKQFHTFSSKSEISRRGSLCWITICVGKCCILSDSLTAFQRRASVLSPKQRLQSRKYSKSDVIWVSQTEIRADCRISAEEEVDTFLFFRPKSGWRTRLQMFQRENLAFDRTYVSPACIKYSPAFALNHFFLSIKIFSHYSLHCNALREQSLHLNIGGRRLNSKKPKEKIQQNVNQPQMSK